MTDQKIDRTDLSHAYNRVTFPGGYETQGDADKVQWAARRAVAALERLHLECQIASTRRAAAVDTRGGKRNRQLLSVLIKARGNRQ